MTNFFYTQEIYVYIYIQTIGNFVMKKYHAESIHFHQTIQSVDTSRNKYMHKQL